MSGLVNGASSDDFYSRKLKNRDADLIKEKGFLWKAAQDDAVARGVSPDDYLKTIAKRRDAWFDAGKLCPRDELEAKLRSVLTSKKGEFSLFIGGKSVGKSFLIKNMCRDLNARGGFVVAVINARATGADLTPSIIAAASRNESAAEQLLFRHFIPRAQSFFKKLGPQVALGPISVDTNVPALIGLFKSADASPVEAMSLFVNSAQAAGLTPSLIVDEANIVFSPQDSETMEASVIAERNRAVLNLLTLMTNEQQSLNVVLVTSEEGYPYELRDDLNFKLQNVDGRIIHAGEVPPKAMRELFMNEWGLGSQLAAGLLAVNGGHVRQASNILEDLAVERAGFSADECPQKGVLAGIYNCSNEGEAKHPGMKKLMRQLGEDGFAPIADPTDARARWLAEQNLAGLVTKERLEAVGLPPDVWESAGARYPIRFWKRRSLQHQHGLVPSSQMARLLILSRI